jgi:hypothetical protein
MRSTADCAASSDSDSTRRRAAGSCPRRQWFSRRQRELASVPAQARTRGRGKTAPTWARSSSGAASPTCSTTLTPKLRGSIAALAKLARVRARESGRSNEGTQRLNQGPAGSQTGSRSGCQHRQTPADAGRRAPILISAVSSALSRDRFQPYTHAPSDEHGQSRHPQALEAPGLVGSHAVIRAGRLPGRGSRRQRSPEGRPRRN